MSGTDDLPRIIVDTDAGIDDAGALFMLLEAHKKRLVNIVAITTCHGNTTVDNVNRNVLRILDKISMLDQIPVFSGTKSPITRPYFINETEFHGQDGFGDSDLPHPDPQKHLQKMPASLKIVEEVQKRPGSINLLAIGPLTNVAVAKMLEPRLLYRLASLHIMGGNTTGEGNESACGEFNFLNDPEAAQNVLSWDGPSSAESEAESKLCPIFITPWETCLCAINIPYEYRLELGRLETPQAALLNAGEARTMDKKLFRTWITCDQIAAAWMLDVLVGDALKSTGETREALCLAKMETFVSVEVQGTHTRGQMILDRCPFKRFVSYAVPASLLTAVNIATYKRYLTMAFGGEF
ncbi:probable uridine nucleosidase 2 [Hyalella azteca]|uniref:Probable uridine nucleosidase 2 n=1 Tax=Hyalella azteca TaxID=294128 RepID=A0A8B7N9F1_HYAAZ|nr:probable uridine nucleosidase 2 [Hyalella azteca]